MSEKKYDVGIFGLWYGCNYGSMITYFALNEVIKDMGYTTVMIKNPLGREGTDLNALPRSHSLRFAAKHYEITPLFHLNEMSKLNQICENFVLGSDQMWNYGLSRPYQQSYFFDFVAENRKSISYATSFGKDTYTAPAEYAEKVKKNLARFAAISVRDDFSKNICKTQFGIKAEQVLDSVFLCPLERYKNLAAECTEERKDFIFVYVLDPNPEFGKEIKAAAEKAGKHVIVIFNESSDKNEAKRRLALDYSDVEYWEEATVNEWLYCFQNSDFVLTDSFHGACFSIIFSKEFIVKKNVGRGGSRFHCLLAPIGLENRMIENIGDMSTLFAKLWTNDKIDYSAVYNRLRPEIEKGRNWLKKALDTPKEKLPSVVIADKSVGADAIWKTIKCTGCGACANVCPVDAISVLPNEEGFMNPSVDLEKCINCGLCTKKCIALQPQYTNNNNPECYAFWASDEIRKISSSGGVFTVAAEYILDKGGYVAGTIYNEDYSVKHTIISNRNDLWKMRGSKYMQSNVGNIYREVKTLLDGGNLVLFTGLPCHVAALYSCLGNKKYDNLYTIDLVCHGITSQKVFDKFHKDVLDGKKITDLQFKAKEPWGWHAGTNAKFEDGTKYSVPLEKCPYFIAYLKCISKNTTCGECQFNKLPRQADFSIGDFWGINKYNPAFNDQKGTSEILVNSEQGAKLLEEIKPAAKLLEPVPLNIALNGNQVMRHPYRMNKNRDYFFKHLDETDFAELTLACFHDDFRNADKKVLEQLAANMHNLYYLGKIVAENARGRKVVAWGEGQLSKKIFKQYFGIDVSFTVYAYGHPVNGTTTRAIESLKGKSNEYYIVSLGHPWDARAEKLLKDLGFEYEKDYIFRVHKPIVLDNFDLSKGSYSDIYGNSITGFSGILKRVVFRGLNSHIHLGKNVHVGGSLNFDMDTNGTVEIDDGCRFVFDVSFELKGNVIPLSTVRIGKNCRFLDALFRIYGHSRNSSIIINDGSTFESHLDLHANAGKKLIIGKDCMFSHNVSVWAGDGHTMFDVKTGKNTNSDYDNIPEHKNKIVIGDHVWVGKGAFVLAGTDIDKGSVIGAQSVVKGKYPNNCVVAGNPAQLVKYDVAWSRDIVTTDIGRCGESEYVQKTKRDMTLNVDAKKKDDIVRERRKVLILGGTGRMSSKLTELCLSQGDDVTIAVRGKHKIGDKLANVKTLIFNRLDLDETKKQLNGKFFDVIFDCSALVPQSVDWVLSCVKTNRYIYISSFETYAMYKKGFDLHEDDLPLTGKYEKEVKINDHSWYQRGKRSSELIISEKYPDINYAIIRIPFVMSLDDNDYDDNLSSRVLKYVSAVINGEPINERNIDLRYSFVENTDEAMFLYFMSHNNFKGVINFASQGCISMRDVIQYVENKTGKKAILDAKANNFPFTLHPEVVLNLDRCKKLNYIPMNLEDWFYKKVDKYISYCNTKLSAGKIEKEKMQTWLVTGGSTGLGRAIVLKLYKLGYKVAAMSRSKEKLNDLPDDIIKLEADIKDINACRRAVQVAIEQMGHIDVLVNNAGIWLTSTFDETPIDVGQNIIDTNYWGVSNMIKAVLPHMRKNRNGTVITISSARGFCEENYASYYVASKFAVDNLIKNLKFECRRFMRFMSVDLGGVNTGILHRRTVIPTQLNEYKNLPPIYPYKKDYVNNLNKIVDSIIEITRRKKLPRSIVLGWDAYQQFPQVYEALESTTEKYKTLSISTDANKKR